MSDAYIIAVAHESGGVGRTTTTLHLGYELARLGRRVCLVDLDSSGDLSRRLGLTPTLPTLAAALAYAEAPPTPQPCQWGPVRLDVLPTDPDLALAELLVTALPEAREYCLERVLAPLLPHYDLVLLDCPAHKGLLLVNALIAADGVLIPVPSQDKAYAALARTTATIAWLYEYHHVVILGYLLTMTTRHPTALVIVAAMRAQGQALVFQTQIPLNPGNSGGPIIDRTGRVVGIVTAGIKEANSINFGIDIGVALRSLSRLSALCDCLTISAPDGVPVPAVPAVIIGWPTPPLVAAPLGSLDNVRSACLGPLHHLTIARHGAANRSRSARPPPCVQPPECLTLPSIFAPPCGA